MATHNDFGRRGEEEACRYLAARGYRLLERNWRISHLEVDIIADYFGEVVFVEVKTRTDEGYASATDAVDAGKRERLHHAARAYMSLKGEDRPFRFDIITVVGARAPYNIQHFINAHF